LWREYLDKLPGGYRYTQFVHHYNKWKGKIKASGILEHKAGEVLYMDFTGKKFPYVDRATGEICQADVFVAILPCSQYTWVKATRDQSREEVVLCLNDCLWWMGGVPKAIVPDNLKTVVDRSHKYAAVINKTLKDFALHYHCVIAPARPYKPKDKALVEGAVKLVYQRIFYPLSRETFFGLKELNRAIAQLVNDYNDYTFQNSKSTRRQRFEEVEKTYLQPLPPGRYLIRQYRRAKVQKIGHIYLSEDQNYYSVPHRYVGMHVEVQYNTEVVEIFYKHERIATHSRSYRPGHYSTVKDHMASSHKAYSDWNVPYFEKRAEGIGEHTLRYIRRLLEQYDYPELGYKQSQGILAFARHYSLQRLEKACKRALEYHRSSYRTIENILKNKLDLDEAEGLFRHVPPSIPKHDNIRGSDHYK
jgi:transposase